MFKIVDRRKAVHSRAILYLKYWFTIGQEKNIMRMKLFCFCFLKQWSLWTLLNMTNGNNTFLQQPVGFTALFKNSSKTKQEYTFFAVLVRYPGVPREGVTVGTFALERPCTESTASTVMQQSLHLKRRGLVLRCHLSLYGTGRTMFSAPFRPQINLLLFAHDLVLFVCDEKTFLQVCHLDLIADFDISF